MAAAVGAPAALVASTLPTAVGTVKWLPSDFHFDPYNLTVAPADKPCTDASDSMGAAGPASALVPQPPVKRRPGRQKRTSVLCQVGKQHFVHPSTAPAGGPTALA